MSIVTTSIIPKPICTSTASLLRAQATTILKRGIHNNNNRSFITNNIAYKTSSVIHSPLWASSIQPHIKTNNRYTHTSSITNNNDNSNSNKSDNNDSTNNDNTSNEEVGRKKVANWLFVCCGLVAGMVLIGGITRLTESGLSIVDWKPIVGAVPPLTQAQWEEEFERYKQYPEYKKLNMGMSLNEFKQIYFMEYLHRLLGRVIGVAFFVPFVWYLKKGYIRGALRWQLGGIFTLGGLQGALGWYMVKSGLDDKLIGEGVPRVSQYRLAAHLGSAFVIYGSMLWLALDQLRPKIKYFPNIVAGGELARLSAKRTMQLTPFTALLIFVTTLSGAFVAGLDAGLIYNTFPYMGGQLVPENIWSTKFKPAIRNCFENDVTVQFQHRVLAITTFCAVVALYAVSRRARPHLPRSTQIALHALIGTVSAQVALGISTLLYFVPVPLAAAHQSGAMTLLSVVLWLVHELKRLPIKGL